MATKTVRVCDKYGTTKDVAQVTITVDRECADGSAEELRSVTFDLSPRAQERLLNAIDKATTPTVAVTDAE